MIRTDWLLIRNVFGLTEEEGDPRRRQRASGGQHAEKEEEEEGGWWSHDGGGEDGGMIMIVEICFVLVLSGWQQTDSDTDKRLRKTSPQLPVIAEIGGGAESFSETSSSSDESLFK